MTDTGISETDLEAIFKHRHRVCPECETDSIVRSATCLTDMLDGDPVTKGFKSDQHPGHRCTADGCDWFELDRDHEGPHPERTRATDPLPDNKIWLNDEEQLSIQDDNVDLRGNTAVYHNEASCPECGDTLKIFCKRQTLDDNETLRATHREQSERYVPVAVRCVNYGVMGGGCGYRR